MKKAVALLAAIMTIGPSCAIKTVFYDVNPRYESHVFQKETIAVCPLNGTWKIEGSDTVLKRVPDVSLYADAVAARLAKKRKCLSVITPDIVMRKVPEIESLLFRNKLLFQKTDSSGASVFRYLYNALNAEYLLYFENIIFNNEEQPKSDTIAVMNSTVLVFQVWDLKNGQFMYRGESKGSGEESRSGRGRIDNRSGKWCIQNTADELVKSLPLCK